MNSILSPATATVDELTAAVMTARVKRDHLRQLRAELDRGAPHDPLERQQWYEARADIGRLDADLNRAEAATLQADGALLAARHVHFADVFAQAKPERRDLLRAMRDGLVALAAISAELVALDADVAAECDGRTFPPDHTWAAELLGVDSRLATWQRELKRDHWL